MDEEEKRTVSMSDYLALQQLKQNSRQFYFAGWNADVVSVEEDRRKTTEIAANIAQVTLKTGALLNGGAIIALPALKGVLGDSVSGEIVIVSVGFFVVGLLLNAISSTWAYIALDLTLNKLNHLREQRAINRNIPDAEDKDERAKLEQRLGEEKRNVDRANEASGKYGRRALCAHWLSLLAFVIGAIIGGLSFSGLLVSF